MKKVCIVLISVAVTMAFISPPVYAAKKYEGESMQVFIGITPKAREQVMEYIAPRLKEKYGITLVGETLGSMAMLEKLVVMKDKPRVSLAGWDVPVGLQASEMGLIVPIDPAKVPNFSDLYDWSFLKDKEGIKVVTTCVI